MALRYVPADVTLTDDEREEIDPDAAGMELYAPVPAYIFCASGGITRAFDGILAMQRQLRDLDFVTVERLELVESRLDSSA